MIPASFDYVRPADLDEALRILREREGEAKLLSGGYSLLPLLKLRLAQPELLVDLRDVGGLDGIAETDDFLRIGGPHIASSSVVPATSQPSVPLRSSASTATVESQKRASA
jgi:aerobic carbon-monoxide dehydrogenase medium subunit